MQKDDFLKLFSEKIEQSEIIKNTRKIISERGSVSFGGLGRCGKVLLIQELIKSFDKKTLFLSENLDELKNIFNDWSIEFDDIVETQNLASPQGRNIILSSFSDIFKKVTSLSDYKKTILNIKVGGELDVIDFSNYLVEIGYERVKKPNSRGEFGVKGDVVDIFIDDEKTRIEFFGDKVEKITGTGLKPKQKSKQLNLKEIYIYPVNIPEGDDYLIRWFDDYMIIIDGEDSFRSYVLTLFSFDEGDLEISEKGIRLLGEIEKFIKNQKVIYLENFSTDEKKGINLSWYEPKKYGGNTADFLTDIKSESLQKSKKITENNSRKVYIFSEKAEQIKRFLINNGINVGINIKVEKRKIIEGVNLQNLGMVVFGDKEIFGELKKKRKKKINFSALTNLKKGEYVVHIDHGIGVFTGFGEISVDGIKREYIFIEYDKGDKIYVPIDQADKITKYIAVTNSPPHLSSLKTGQWLKIRKKVKENAEKIARELIEAQALREGEKPFYYVNDEKEQKILEKTFAHHETPDQAKAIKEVLDDMKERKPMDRLVCGDVGYGKTEVAVRSAARAVVSGGQVAILVPTTILAEQHLQTFEERLDRLGFKIKSLSRFIDAKKQKKIIEDIKKGSVDIVIGTHRLLSKDIEFKNLNLIIIDEEQKFGVKHKEKLKNLRAKIDILTMTATPIPRTLYLGLGGLKDISLIQTPPEGRLPIKTVVIKNDDEVIKNAVMREIERGGQVYIVHNRVETIVGFASKLKKIMPKISFVIGHGQMDDKKLAQIMNDFAKGKYQVLVCSTIIESGLDISTVNTLIVDKATNFGLSQLHQLRGRIGRSHAQAYAYFLYNSEDLKGNAQKRLKAISEKEALGSGYELSLEDLDIRGSGNILGEEQHGSMQMVGVGYYLKMLEEAVDNLKSKISNLKNKESLRDDIKIDLPISTYIPDGFYEKEEEKIKAYQVLSGFEYLEEVEDFLNSLNNISKNQDIPQEYLNLIDVIKIKIKARNSGVKSVIVKDVLGVGERKIKKLYIEFDHILSREEVGRIFALNRDWYFGNTLARIDLKDLGDDWFKKIKMTFDNLGK
mgnify:CR=1 FL=1|uniref:Transcription-repair-coupling factor n=1 Tax=candidate division CPR3 bacterium TaxID=2268181 RepID=A0A7C4R5Q2_UNCC3